MKKGTRPPSKDLCFWPPEVACWLCLSGKLSFNLIPVAVVLPQTNFIRHYSSATSSLSWHPLNGAKLELIIVYCKESLYCLRFDVYCLRLSVLSPTPQRGALQVMTAHHFAHLAKSFP